MAVLIKKEILPFTSPKPSFQTLKPGEYKMKILFTGLHIGNMHTIITANPDKSYSISEKFALKKNLITKNSPFEMTGQINTAPNSELKNFFYTFTMFGETTAQSGYQREDHIELITTKNGETSVQKIPGKGGNFFSGSLMPLFDTENLAVGKEWNIEWMNPLTSSRPETAQAKVESRETLSIDGKKIETYLVKLVYQKTEFSLWTDMKGDIIKFAGFGFVFIREGL